MRKILEEILWNIYYQTENSVGGRNDARFFGMNNILKDIHNFSAKQLSATVADLKKEKLIEEKKNYEGSVSISLTEKGMLRAINYRFRRLGNKKEKWDGKWRMVFFNIPENRRRGRDALRYRLKMAGFYRMQESIFIFPYECEREIRDFIKLYKMEKYVRFGLLDFIDDSRRIEKLFHVT
jgi:DNA-binding transcriptional regulator PaaX